MSSPDSSLPQPPTMPHCYRHPNREAGRSCTRCGRPACSDCLVQAAVGSHCLDCAKAARPDVATRAKLASSSVLTPVTYSIIGINVAVFLWMAAADSNTMSGRVTELHADLGLSKLILQGRILGFDRLPIPEHEWYRLVTSGFIHFGLFHIAMNMLLLFQLGNLVERALGGTRMVLIYVASLLAGSLGVLLVDSGAGVSGGASGAVFGLMAGAAVGLHRRGVNVFSTGIGTTLLLNIVLTFTISGISKGGHVGGAIGGAICGFVMLAPGWKPLPKWATYATPIAVALVALVGSVAIVG
ncbi:MAG: rhomboid family intramembrane serine protease [Actinomycetota bacterium]|nr:rhomboid family intramembrane serine protease [Actinomycetota bacterium]